MRQNARKPLKKAVIFGIMTPSFSNRECYVRRTIQPLAAFLAILPIGLLLMVDFFIESFQLAEKLIPHLAFGVLIAQLLCLVAFIKGENLSRAAWTFN